MVMVGVLAAAEAKHLVLYLRPAARESEEGCLNGNPTWLFSCFLLAKDTES